MSNAIAIFKNARVSGQVSYTPAYTKPGTGAPVPQKCSIPTIINNPPYINDQGKLIETDKVLVFITAWGKLADTCAKYLAEGKQFSCDCNINSYQSKVIDPATNKAILNSAFQPVVTIKQGYTMIPSSFSFGQDSEKQIANEGREPGWDGKLSLGMIEAALANGTIGDVLARAKQGPAIWAAKRELLKKLEYSPGMKEFGAARVVLAEGAAQTAYAPLAQQIAAATAPTVNGFTYAQLKENKWTDAQLLQTEYASLVPRAVPAPPASVPTAPPAPPVDGLTMEVAGPDVGDGEAGVINV